MRKSRHGSQRGRTPQDLREQGRRNVADDSAPLKNFNTRSYRFNDLDLKIAVGRLPARDQTILILHLMGHNQPDIGRVFGVTRSMISKRLRSIRESLRRHLE